MAANLHRGPDEVAAAILSRSERATSWLAKLDIDFVVAALDLEVDFLHAGAAGRVRVVQGDRDLVRPNQSAVVFPEGAEDVFAVVVGEAGSGFARLAILRGARQRGEDEVGLGHGLALARHLAAHRRHGRTAAAARPNQNGDAYANGQERARSHGKLG